MVTPKYARRSTRRRRGIAGRTVLVAGLWLALAAVSTGVYLRSTQAASVAASAQAEAATVTGAAGKVTSASASGGSAVAFGGAPNCVTPSSLALKDQYENPPRATRVWKRFFNQKATIYFETGRLNAEYREYVNLGARNWSTTACVNVVSVLTCPARVNCVPVTFTNQPSDSARAWSYRGTSGGYVVESYIEMNTAVLNGASTAQRRVTTIHEMGHSIGLEHRANSQVMMYGGGSKPTASVMPDATDAHNLLVPYGPQRNTPPAGSSDASGSPISEPIEWTVTVE